MLWQTYRAVWILSRPNLQVARRLLVTSPVATAAQLPPRMVVNEDDIEESFLKGSGPGGQKIVCPFDNLYVNSILSIDPSRSH